ncbi:MAG: protein translocase subunit SecD [Solirubrobacterales bacterium]
MSRGRRHLFVLLFVLGLVAVSALVIATRPTKLGLDLKGGVELIYQGKPSGQVKEVTGSDINRSIEIIRRRIDKLGVSEPEVSRLGTTEISVSLPDVKNAQRAIDQVGTTAQLYFYDWEPNLIGPEKVIGGRPGLNPPPAALKASRQRWREAGRNPSSPLAQQLVLSGAYPTAYDATQLAAKQEPVPDCTNCSASTPRYYLFGRAAPHRLIAGPETSVNDLYVSPTGQKRPRSGLVVKVPVGTIVVAESPSDSSGTTVPPDQFPPGWYALRDRPALSGTDITNPEQNYDPTTNAPNVTFGFTDKGRTAFQDVTRTISQRGANSAAAAGAIGSITPDQAAALSGHFAVVLDNVVVTRPIINFQENPDGIDGRQGAQISGGFQSVGEAQDLATTLQIGALPINLKLISQTQVSATLGQQALDEGIKAGLVGVVLVVIFLIAFYRFLGLIASIALGAYGVIFFALIKLIPITLTLPGIAGLVLTIGVAADSNIVIFERIKEEVRAGRSMPSAIAAGYRRGIATIIDANVVTLLTAFILFVLATAGVKGFAFTLGIGTIVSLLTAVVFTQALLGTMSRSRFLRSPSMLGAAKQRFRWHFDFMGASRWFFSISGCILLIGSLSLATKQLNFGIDFESGTRITVALVKPTDEGAVRSTLSSAGIDGEEIQKVSDPVLGNNVFQIQTRQLQPGRVKDARRALGTEFGVAADGFDSTSVGPTFGQQVASSALKALILSLLVICAYVAFRFQPKFAIPVLIALFHDVLITAGIYSLTGREVTTGTVAAFLTILGYSLYDTIIVFDRIRENLPRMPRAAFSQIVNRSMSEVLTRSLATSFSTLIGVASLLVFGGVILKDFAFAMLVGIASGTYSSIFIASPVLTAWKEREPAFRRRRARIERADGAVPPYAEEAAVARIGEEEPGEGAAPEEDLEAVPAGSEAAVAVAEVPSAPTGAKVPEGAEEEVAPEAGQAEPSPAPERQPEPPSAAEREPSGTGQAEPSPAPERQPSGTADGSGGEDEDRIEAETVLGSAAERAARRERNAKRRAARAKRRHGRHR